MNSPVPIDDEVKRIPIIYLFLRCSIAFLFPLIFLVLVAFTVVIFTVFVSNFSISYPISVPCQCKIVSSNVDLRSAKVCELGLLNYKAKHVFYPSEKKKFRCRYDYYWASVFEVEYTDHAGHPHTAFAETPNEALPADCRPTFNAAWMAKDSFKVNETYSCWYTLGISKLNLYYDELFDCHTDHPSMTEMLKRYVILSMDMLTSWFLQGRYVKWEAIAGAFFGSFTSLITIAVGRILYLLKSRIRVQQQKIHSVKVLETQHSSGSDLLGQQNPPVDEDEWQVDIKSLNGSEISHAEASLKAHGLTKSCFSWFTANPDALCIASTPIAVCGFCIATYFLLHTTYVYFINIEKQYYLR